AGADAAVPGGRAADLIQVPELAGGVQRIIRSSGGVIDVVRLHVRNAGRRPQPRREEILLPGGHLQPRQAPTRACRLQRHGAELTKRLVPELSRGGGATPPAPDADRVTAR